MNWREKLRRHDLDRNPAVALARTARALGVAVERLAEVGVYTGTNARRLRKEFPGARLWLVDPWAKYRVRGKMQRKSRQEDWDRIYVGVREAFADDPLTVLVRSTSCAAAPAFPPGGLDLVYIDADHRYEHVAADIRAWWPVVRVGGIVAGHDYFKGRALGVGRAVRELIGEDRIVTGRRRVWIHWKQTEGLPGVR